MKVLILGAGYATRLYPLTLDRPKPLLSVAGKPVIEYILDLIERVEEIREIIVVTNEKFYRNFKEWHRTYKTSKRITILNDKTLSNEDRLGATGDIEFSIRVGKLDEDLLILAGDNIFQADLSMFLKFSRKKRPYITIGLYDVGSLRLAKKYGIVSLNRDNLVLEFKEKPQKPASTLAAKCLYFFPKEKLGIMKEYLDTKGAKDAPGYFLEWLYKKENVYGYVFKEEVWFDIGDKKSLEEANRVFRKEV